VDEQAILRIFVVRVGHALGSFEVSLNGFDVALEFLALLFFTF